MKVEAFTIMELLLVMALTGLAIAISWGIYAQFHLFGQEYELRNRQASELSLLHTALNMDSRRATAVTAGADSLHFSGPRSSVYSRIPTGLVRSEGNVKDTFWMPIQPFEVNQGIRATEITLSLQAEGQGQTLRYHVLHPPTAIQP